MTRALALLALVLGAWPALAEAPLSLAEALREAGRTSLSAQVARLSTDAARADEAQVRGAYWPELQFQGGYQLLGEQPGLRSQPIALGSLTIGPFQTPPLTVPSQVFPTEDTRAWRYRVALQYVVWDFGRRGDTLRAAQARTEGTERQGQSEIRRAQAEVASRYLALLDLAAQRRVLVQRKAALEAHHAAVTALFEHGVVARNDLLRTEVALRRVEDGDRALEAGEASTREALNVALGRPAQAALDLPADLALPPVWPW
ncbi:MAG TPA: TolC family protein, partial [Holophagaceae bacterium]